MYICGDPQSIHVFWKTAFFWGGWNPLPWSMINSAYLFVEPNRRNVHGLALHEPQLPHFQRGCGQRGFRATVPDGIPFSWHGLRIPHVPSHQRPTLVNLGMCQTSPHISGFCFGFPQHEGKNSPQWVFFLVSLYIQRGVTLPPTNMAPDRGSLQENHLPGTSPSVPC